MASPGGYRGWREKNVLLVSKRCYKINDCLWIRMLLLPEYLVFGFYMYLCEKTIDI